MTWNDELCAWSSWLLAANSRLETVKLRRYQMERLARELGTPPWSVTAEQLTAWLGRPGWSTETRRSHLAAVRSFYGWARATGRIEVDPARLLRPVKPAEPRPRPAADSDVAAAIMAADERVRLMIALGSHGLRRGEIARAHTDALRADLGGVALDVDGKGGKHRLVPLTDALGRELGRLPAGWVFPSPAGGHLTPAHVGKLISRCLPAGVTPHQLRHRFATRAYAATRDIEAVRQLLGHASLMTTQRYVATPADALRAAVVAAA